MLFKWLNIGNRKYLNFYQLIIIIVSEQLNIVFYRVASSLGAPTQLNTPTSPTVENESPPQDLPNNNSNLHL